MTTFNALFLGGSVLRRDIPYRYNPGKQGRNPQNGIKEVEIVTPEEMLTDETGI
jgi:hypothetical protein